MAKVKVRSEDSENSIPVKDADNDWNSLDNTAKDSDDVYEEAARSTADYANYESPKKDHSPIWKKLFITLLVLILIGAVVAGAAWFIKNQKSSKPKATPTGSSQASSSSAGKIAATTKHYDSSNFYLGLDIPQDWVVVDNGGGIMTITSPAMQLKSADGQSVQGKIVLTFRDKTQKLSEFDGGNSVAVIDSKKINYVKPTQSQRGSTYVTYVRYAKTTASGGLDSVYVTGDNGYKVGQAVPKADITQVDPVISVSFTKCKDNNCSTAGTPLTITTVSWDDSTLSGSVEAIIKSLAIT